MVWHNHNHLQVLHLRVELQEAKALGCQPMLKASFALHLHLQQHHRLLGCARFCRARPEGAIEAVVRLFELRRS
ncbi:hypothetical protein KBY61_08245 [Cyanobium sp. To12R1]|nr:hypothetical protein [Cyanobium sp. To12R1]